MVWRKGELGNMGQVIVFEIVFKAFGNNAYDIANVMTHEAVHAWQQYTLTQLAQDPETNFAQYGENLNYYTVEWGEKYTPWMEYEASSYVLLHNPKPLCTRQAMRDNENRYKNQYFNFTPPPGISISPWPMAGYPLP